MFGPPSQPAVKRWAPATEGSATVVDTPAETEVFVPKLLVRGTITANAPPSTSRASTCTGTTAPASKTPRLGGALKLSERSAHRPPDALGSHGA